MLQGISALIWVSKWCVCVFVFASFHFALSTVKHTQTNGSLAAILNHVSFHWRVPGKMALCVCFISLYIWHRWRPFYGMATHTHSLSLHRPSNRLMAFELNPVSFYFHWFSLHFKTVAHLNTWTLELFSFFHFSLVCKKTVQQKIKTFLLL